VTVREVILAVALLACGAAVVDGVADLSVAWAKVVGGVLGMVWTVLVFGDDGRPPMRKVKGPPVRPVGQVGPPPSMPDAPSAPRRRRAGQR
jgi:hypothetical protein